jgi:NTE family protein
LPGIFPPVRLGGRWLVDGALVNPVAVSAARALGARVVIAVHLNSDLSGRGTVIASHGSDENDEAPIAPAADGNVRRSGFTELLTGGHSLLRAVFGSSERPGIPTVMIEAFNVMQDRITRARMAGDPPDVLIAPKVGSVGWFDFHRAAEAIELGVQATEKVLPEIEENLAALSTPTAPIEALRQE